MFKIVISKPQWLGKSPKKTNLSRLTLDRHNLGQKGALPLSLIAIAIVL